MSDTQSLNPGIEAVSVPCANLKAAIEAFLFVSERPLLVDQIKGVFEDVEPAKIRQALVELKSDYETHNRGLRIVEIAGGYQIVTSLEVADILKKFYKLRDAARLSKSALETLAIIAYKQPVTRLDIESLRGVNVDGMVRSLMEKNLIRIAGRKDIIGRPFVYGTTKQFLEYFGLASLDALPRIEEFTKNAQAPTQLLSISNRTEAFISGATPAENDAAFLPEAAQEIAPESAQKPEAESVKEATNEA